MPADSQDDLSLSPTELDRAKLEDLIQDGRVESENGTWVVLRYPDLPAKGPMWCQYALIINHPALRPRLAEFKNMQALTIYLGIVEQERLKRIGRG